MFFIFKIDYSANIFFTEIEAPKNPCSPSPCGPNSVCKVINDQSVCTCLPEYRGSPPNCKPECIVSTECVSNRACVNLKCVDPCIGQCGHNANCLVINHSPICSCQNGFTGDPFSRCYQLMTATILQSEPKNPCLPSPCGPFSECRDIGGIPSCTCSINYIGAPPACRPECVINSDCSSNLACINQRCQDPCPGSCGLNAKCRVTKNIPICTCIENYVGDAFTECKQQGKLFSFWKKFTYFCLFLYLHILLKAINIFYSVSTLFSCKSCIV